jgi:DNA-binding response OmpR family regulator
MMTKVLVIDDEEIIRERLSKLLELDDYETFTAGDGEEGLKIVNEEKPEIALVDIKMPGLDGIEVLRKIREDAEETQVILITGHGGVETAIQALKEGAFGYIQKPIDYDELEIEIKRALEKQEMQRKLDEYVDNLEKAIKEKTEELARRKLAEEALQEAHAKLESLYQQLQQDHKIAEKVFAKMVHRGCLDAPNMGDFTAHGLYASLGAIPASEIFYAMTSKGFNIGEIAMEMNKKLNAALPTGLFLAVCLIQLDSARGTLTLWNGALPDVVVVGREGGIKNRLKSRNVPLGVVSGVKLDSTTEVIEIAQGDHIFVYSDGLIEAHKPGGEMFGQERLDKYFSRNQAPGNLFDKIRAGLATFCKGAPQSDDITMIEITCDKEAVLPIKIEPPSDPARTYMMSWKMITELKADSLRTGDPLPLVTRILAEDQRLSRHKENVYMILAELFSNALEYGLLRLDAKLKKDAKGFDRYYIARERALADLKEGSIKIDLEHLSEHEGGKLVVRIEDSGPGFDYHKILPSLGENMTLGGRGIPLLRSLCQELVYHGRGNRVEAVYVWS